MKKEFRFFEKMEDLIKNYTVKNYTENKTVKEPIKNNPFAKLFKKIADEIKLKKEDIILK